LRDDIINLISTSIVDDDIGNQIPQEVSKEVFCTIESISQSEYFQASQSGLKSQFKITISEFDYDGETITEYNSKRFTIYRTYLKNDERIELYLATKAGV
jgi:SPP1 family predicted phage head-tail adaptor